MDPYTRNGFKIAKALMVFGVILLLSALIYPAFILQHPALPMIDAPGFLSGAFTSIMLGLFLGVLCEISTKLGAHSSPPTS